MTNRERLSDTTSSVSVGRCAMSTVDPFGERPPYDAQKGAVGLEGTVSRVPARTRPCRGGGAGTRGPRPAGRSDAAALGRAGAVVRLRGDVLDRADLEPGRGERADRGLAAGARALDEDVDLLQAVFLRLACGGLGGHLRGVGGRLARALEADLARGGPGDDGTGRVRDGHDGVVERALDVSLSVDDVLLVLAARLARSGGL